MVERHKLTGRASLSDNVLVVLCIDADLCVIHCSNQLLGLVLQKLFGLFGLFWWALDLDDVTAVRKLDMNLTIREIEKLEAKCRREDPFVYFGRDSDLHKQVICHQFDQMTRSHSSLFVTFERMFTLVHPINNPLFNVIFNTIITS